MTRKRRMFDIDIPEDAVAESQETTGRRSPMASAIAENAEALQARKSAAEAIRDENDALAHEFVALREAGNVVEMVPLGDVHTYMLVRDRIPGEDFELAELVTSVREIGLSNPIRVLPRPDGSGYELVQGFRRLGAYKALLEETGDEAWARIPALIMPGAGDIGGLYRRMVDENIVRKDLSFAEMAHAAQVYAADPATEAKDLGAAIAALFQSAPYSKRSYIKSFALVMERLGAVLMFPTEVPRALGVALAKALKDAPEIADMIRLELADDDNRGIQEEMEVLRRYADWGDAPRDMGPPPPKPVKTTGGKTKTTFHIRSRAGQVKCTASAGRLEIKVDRDFSAIDRQRLERAIASLIDGLG
ncbi:ParB/RepB/Spo0J family partition protein [Marinovum sp. KMM 9879]